MLFQKCSRLATYPISLLSRLKPIFLYRDLNAGTVILVTASLRSLWPGS